MIPKLIIFQAYPYIKLKVTVLSASHATQLVFLAQSNHSKEENTTADSSVEKSEPVADASY